MSARDMLIESPETRNELRRMLAVELEASRRELLSEEAAFELEVAGPQPAMLLKAKVQRMENALEALGPEEQLVDATDAEHAAEQGVEGGPSDG